MSIVITAYNEEKNIKNKIENCLSLDYSRDLLEIIIVSDGSNDNTANIISSYNMSEVKLLEIPERRGKDYCQGQGTISANGEILVYTDVTTFLERKAVREIVDNFSDPHIGCVSGHDLVLDSSAGGPGEGAYVRYEMALRNLESSVNTLVVVSGCFFAIRKKLCQKWYPDLTSDFYLPIISYMEGYRTVIDKDAVATYNVVDDPQREYQRKVRTVVNGLSVLLRFAGSMNIFRYGLFSIQIISHKLIRWLVPFLLALALISNMFIINHGRFYLVILLLQLVFYIFALSAYISKPLRSIVFFKIPLYFSLVNLSILVAWGRFIAGEKQTIWEPTKR